MMEPSVHSHKQVVGTGASSTVVLETENTVRKIFGKDCKKQYAREMHALQLMCKSPEFVTILGNETDNDKNMSILMKRKMGTLEQDILTHGAMSEELVSGVVYHMLLPALRHLAAQSIVHRDLKPDNVLIEKTGRVKIADFGESGFSKRTFHTPMVGSPTYMSPESWGTMGHDHKRDVWSLGILCLRLMRPHHPWFTMSEAETRLRLSALSDRLMATCLGASLGMSPVTTPEVFMEGRRRHKRAPSAAPCLSTHITLWNELNNQADKLGRLKPFNDITCETVKTETVYVRRRRLTSSPQAPPKSILAEQIPSLKDTDQTWLPLPNHTLSSIPEVDCWFVALLYSEHVTAYTCRDQQRHQCGL
eukprot:Platyproteum_vivax@DN7299_c0_g1_i1.p2